MQSAIVLFLFLSIFCLSLSINYCFASPIKEAQEDEYFIIDADAGSDDALALMYTMYSMWQNPHHKLLAVTTVAGNTVIENVIKNVALTLQMMGQNNVPIYKGTTSSILGGSVTDGYFGSDGLSNATHHYPDPGANVEDKNAVIALVDLVKQYPKQVTILCLGPLTNIALAYLLEPNFFDLTKQLYIIGGSFSGLGNVNAAAEFNFHFDPEAAYIVVTRATCPTYVIPWETMKHQSILWHKYEELTALQTERAQFFTRITSVLHSMKGGNSTVENFVVGDLLAAFAYFTPHIVGKIEKWPATVELHGSHTRGQLVLDKRFNFQHGLNFILEMNVDEMFELFKKMLLDK